MVALLPPDCNSPQTGGLQTKRAPQGARPLAACETA